MKINIKGYEIDIRAKFEYGRDRANKADAQAFLNYVACLAGGARDYWNLVHCNAIAAEADRVQNTIYTALKAQGYYDDLED